jgi:hypothetical protein
MLGGGSGTQTLSHISGTLTLAGTSAGSDHAVYNLNGGGLTGSGSFALAGILNWTGGILGSSGATLVVAANGGLAISGVNGKSFIGVTLVNNVSGTWSGGQISCSGAVFSNAPSATFDFLADGSAFVLSSGTPLLVNSGTLRKTAGAGTTTTTVRCNNTGSVQVNSGTLALALADSSGSFGMSLGNTLSVSGTATLSASASVDGAGNFTVTSGTLTNNGTFHVDGTTTFTSGSMTLNGSCYITNGPLVINGGTVTFNGTGFITPGSLTLSAGSLQGSMPVTVPGVMSWTGGVIGSGSSPIVFANGGLTISGVNGKNFNGGALVNNGVATWSGGQVSFSGTAVFSNAPSAMLDFQGDGSAFIISSGTPLLVNSGILRKIAGTGTTTLTLRCNNAGSVQVNSGALALAPADSNGSFSASAGNTLSINGSATFSASASIDGAGNFIVTSGTFTNNGTFHIDGTNTFASGTIAFNGSCFITNNPMVINGGTVIFNGSGIVAPTLLNLSAGNLQGSMTLTVPGLITWTGGIIGANGSSLAVVANGGLSIIGAAQKTFNGGMVVNNGLAIWTGGQVSWNGTPVFSNAPGATLDFQADGNAFILNSGTPTVLNSGILRKSTGTGTTIVTVRCNNAGSVQVNSGTVALTLGDSSGSFALPTGTTLSVNGIAVLSSTASIDGAGNFTVTSGIITNNGSFHVDGTNTFTSGSITFNGSSFITNNPMVINNGTVVFSGSGVVAPTLLNMSAGSLQGSMTVAVPGLTSWTGGTIGANGSSLVFAANGGLAISGGSKNLNGGTLANNGPGTWTGSAITCNNSGVFSNAPSGLLDLQADGTAFSLNAGNPLLVNSGILRKSAGAGTTTVGIRCNNAGSVQVNSGTLALTLGDSTGAFAVAAGTTLSVNGFAVLSTTASIDGPGNFTVTSATITNNGSFHIDGVNTFTSGTIALNGRSFITNGPIVINGGTVVFNGTGIIAPASLSLSAGSLQGNMAVTVSGLTAWSGATILGSAGSSLLVIASGGLVISNAQTKSFNGGTLVNNGAGTWSGGQITCINNAILSNAPAATFDLTDGSAFGTFAGNPRVLNAGMLRKSTGSGTTTVGIPCNNSGTVEVNSGTLALTVGDGSGSFTVASGSLLSVNGNANLSPSANISGAGNFTITAGTITNNGSFHVDGTNTFSSGGTIALNGNCVLTNVALIVNGGTVIFAGTGTIAPSSLSLSTGGLLGTMPVAVSGPMTWTGGILGSAGSSLLVVANGGLTISGTGVKPLNGGTLLNNGTATWSGSGQITAINNAIFSNAPSALLDLQADGVAFGTFAGAPALINAGTLRKSAGSGTSSINLACTNFGLVQGNTGTLSFGGNFTQTSGQATLNGGSFAFVNTAQLLGGTLQGSGAIAGSVSNNAAVSPGPSPGLISISGTYSEGPNAHLAIELGGTTAGSSYDQLSVGGKATLRGSLDVSFVNGFVPGPGNVFTVLVCNARSGAFGSLNTPTNNLGAIYTAKTVLLETGNASPVAQLSVDPFQLACHTFLLSASGTDPDGSVTNITLLLDTNVLASAAGGSVQTPFNSDFPGDVTFTVLATDNKGASGGTNVTVHLGTFPTLVLDPVGFQTNRAFKLCMLGEAGTNYQVIANDDLNTSNWLVLGTMENTNGIWRFSDSAATNSSHRFYRAQLLQ